MNCAIGVHPCDRPGRERPSKSADMEPAGGAVLPDVFSLGLVTNKPTFTGSISTSPTKENGRSMTPIVTEIQEASLPCPVPGFAIIMASKRIPPKNVGSGQSSRVAA